MDENNMNQNSNNIPENEPKVVADEVIIGNSEKTASFPSEKELTENKSIKNEEPAVEYTVSSNNESKYFQTDYQSPRATTYYTPAVKKKKKKDPLVITFIIIAAVLVVSIIGIAVTAILMNKPGIIDNNGQDAVTDNNKDNSQNDNGSTPNISVYSQPSSGEKTIPQVVSEVRDSVVGIVVSTQNQYSISSEGQGSGIIFSEDGYIITNAHVVSGASSIKVVLTDAKQYQATLIGSDEKTDLAVIKINATGLKAATFGDSGDLVVGQTVIAIGNPYGLELAGSVTAGIVSALDRNLSIENVTMKLIQTDAAINPGNSGGALVNTYGQVIGINSSKIVAEYSEGLGFSIPVSDAVPIIKELISNGYVTGRPMIGITGSDINSQYASIYNIPVGIYVSEVDKTSSAYKAGLREGDIITQFNGEAVSTMSQLDSKKEEYKAGDKVTLTFYRMSNGKTSTISIVLQENKGK